MANQLPLYGRGDATFQAVGGESGVRQLVDKFYDLMCADLRYSQLRELHPFDLTVSRDKLTRFLCGWMGGERTYAKHYGSINIPHAHAHLPVTQDLKNQWLACMSDALESRGIETALSEYLLKQLSIPAERIRQVAQGQG